MSAFAAADLDGAAGVVVRPTACQHTETWGTRKAPTSVMDACTFRDLYTQTTSDHVLVLKHTHGHSFDVMAGAADGLHRIEPNVAGGELYAFWLDDHSVLVSLENRESYHVDLSMRAARKLGDHPAGVAFLIQLHGVLASITNDALVLFEAKDGVCREVRRVALPAGTGWNEPLAGGRVLVLEPPNAGLVFLGVRGRELWLLGGTDPAELGPGNAKIGTIDVPPGTKRLFATRAGESTRLEAHNLEEAWRDAVEHRPADMGDRLAAEPWTLRKVEVRLG
jgi:hypothetical protein